ncbi:MAG TPA: right-handed parallel beta-helix repeat-containing protein [Acidimicrobiales bacterium]|jgi:parallel beta-helix repeat protein|nr:right-handed parallel beta-helix repeat-containing protein [Acidimicrobiales bacterium]
MRHAIGRWCAVFALMGGLVGVGVAAAAPAVAASSRNFVAPNASEAHSGNSCATAKYASIQAAVEATSAGGTVIVCPGTFPGGVTIDRQLTLQGLPGAVIDADGAPYGVGVAASYSKVLGLTIEHATASEETPGDGIVTAGFTEQGFQVADHVTIVGNHLVDNGGAGIDIQSSSYNTVVNNDSEWNGIGINVSDDLGAPSSHNVIQSNVASNNPGGCGIVLADHSGAGIFSNIVVGNTADNNGLGTPSAPEGSSGSGIILAGGAGGVYGNTVAGNTFDGNGHAGIALHGHAPGMNFSGNVLSGNSIGTNNLRQDFMDPETTGIYLGDASPLSIVVSGNKIHDNEYGIFTAGQVTLIGSNTFTNVSQQRGSTPSY